MKQQSAFLSALATILCMAALAVLCIFAVPLAKWYVDFQSLRNFLTVVIVIIFYVSAVPAMLALVCLLSLLRRIHKGNAFDAHNARLLALIGWCCLAVAAACFVGGFFYVPFFLVTAAMLFLFLIVRVVRNCFVTAAQLQEENNLTI